MFTADRWLPASLRRYRFWYLRLLLLWLLLSLIIAPGPRAPLQPPQTVETSDPAVCVHTRLIDEVWEWKIQRSLQLVREMGAGTIVEFFPWAYIEYAPNQYDWASTDRIVRHAQNQGLRIIARMGLVPAWARPDNDFATLNFLPPESYPHFASFVGQFAARYAGTIDQIIIWNEPNLAFEWGYQQVDPAGYVEMLAAVYAAVKEAAPDVMVIAAPLAPTLEPEGSPNGLNDLLYLEAMYRAGLADYTDALAIHTYGFTDPPAAEPQPEALNFRRAELLYDIMRRYDTADKEKPVYITETGWNDHPRWTKAVSPAQRIAYTLDAFRWAQAEWPWLETLCLWVFRYPAPAQSYPDNFTLVTSDFQLKPIYYALQNYARGWERDEPLWLPPPATDSASS